MFGETLRESQGRNKQREIRKDREKEGVGEMHETGSVTGVSNENESGEDSECSAAGGPDGESLNVLNNRGPEIIS